MARDGGDWICLQCGSYAYVGLYSGAEPGMDSLAEPALDAGHMGINPEPSFHGEAAEKSLTGKGAVATSEVSMSPVMGGGAWLALQTCQVTPW